jgi:hypothetical protein
MTKRVLITKGFQYGGKVLDVADADATTATADSWATDLTGDYYPYDMTGVDRYAPEPPSMKTFIAKANGSYVAPGPVPIVSISKAAVAVVTVGAGDIGKFSNGMVVTIAGVTGAGWTGCNGSKTVAGKTGNTFTIGTDTSAATGTAPTATGTVTPPAA